ncbi:MAG: hypothetical protein D6798_12510 [Deltaproteobacteria bacterium]|nr:MAG: hypothetical protein D6798_12510 [Deltaproteobacteria bacterium]
MWNLLPPPVLALLVGCAGPTPGDGGPDGWAEDGGADPAVAEAPTWSVHPEIVTVLEVTWTQQEAVQAWVEFQDADGNWLASPPQAGTAGRHTEVLLGLTADQPTQIRVAVTRDDGSTERSEAVAARTDPLPDPRLQPLLTAWEPEALDDAPYVLGSIEINDTDYYWGPFTVFIVDRQGRIVWYHQTGDDDWTLFPRVARNGSHVLYERGKLLAFGSDPVPTVQRRTLDGRQVEDIALDHLGFTYDELPDGSIIFDDYATRPDLLLSEQAPDGSRRTLWDCTAWIGDRCGGTWCCAPNAIIYRPESDSILWSMWDSDAVVEVDRGTGQVLRHWGMLDGAWDFDPPDAGFDKQHWPNFTPAGTLLVSTHTIDGTAHRFREYALDEDAEVLRQVWSTGEGVDLFPIHHGEAVRLPGGQTLLNYGTEGVIRELGADGSLAWELAWEQPWMLGHTSLVDDLYALNTGW